MRALALLPLLFLTAAAPAPPERFSTLVVYGNDPCPRSSATEIVVCARQPENERYRLPKRFRGRPDAPAAKSWTDTARVLEMVSRAGLPNSCSPIGSYGQSGCFRKFLEANRAARQVDSEAAIP